MAVLPLALALAQAHVFSLDHRQACRQCVGVFRQQGDVLLQETNMVLGLLSRAPRRHPVAHHAIHLLGVAVGGARFRVRPLHVYCAGPAGRFEQRSCASSGVSHHALQLNLLLLEGLTPSSSTILSTCHRGSTTGAVYQYAVKADQKFALKAMKAIAALCKPASWRAPTLPCPEQETLQQYDLPSLFYPGATKWSWHSCRLRQCAARLTRSMLGQQA